MCMMGGKRLSELLRGDASNLAGDEATFHLAAWRTKMHYKSIVAVLIGIATATEANAYQWANNRHACIVERARYSKTTTDEQGKWGNAPKSFFVSISTCADFAKAKKVSWDLSGDVWGRDADLSDIVTVKACADAGGTLSMDSMSVIQPEGLDFFCHDFPPNTDLLWRPVGCWMGVLKLGERGTIDFTKLGGLTIGDQMWDLADGDQAWLTLHARCVVSEP